MVSIILFDLLSVFRSRFCASNEIIFVKKTGIFGEFVITNFVNILIWEISSEIMQIQFIILNYGVFNFIKLLQLIFRAFNPRKTQVKFSTFGAFLSVTLRPRHCL